MLRRAASSLALLLVSVSSVAHASDDEWGSSDDEGLHLEISHTVGMGAILTEDPPYFAGTLEVALMAYLPRDVAGDSGDEQVAWGLLVGDSVGLAPRAMVIANGSQSAAPWAVAVGAGLVFHNRILGSEFRVPTLLGLLMPELGAIFRASTATAFYISWEVPFCIRLDRHAALDVSFRVYAIDDWLAPRVEEPGIEPWNYVTTVNMGLRLIE